MHIETLADGAIRVSVGTSWAIVSSWHLAAAKAAQLQRLHGANKINDHKSGKL